MIEKLYNADFRAVLPQILAEYADRRIVVVSDPPFNIGYHYNEYRDKLGSDEYQSLMRSAFGGGTQALLYTTPRNYTALRRQSGACPTRWLVGRTTQTPRANTAMLLFSG